MEITPLLHYLMNGDLGGHGAPNEIIGSWGHYLRVVTNGDLGGHGAPNILHALKGDTGGVVD
jgi:hypothetical protein